MIEDLTEKNINAYVIMSYDNPQCVGMEEFEDDLKIPKYIKRLINRYLSTGELKERLILNHIILFYNVFGYDAATRILFFKLDESDYSILKTFLTYFEYKIKFKLRLRPSCALVKSGTRCRNCSCN